MIYSTRSLLDSEASKHYFSEPELFRIAWWRKGEKQDYQSWTREIRKTTTNVCSLARQQTKKEEEEEEKEEEEEEEEEKEEEEEEEEEEKKWK